MWLTATAVVAGGFMAVDAEGLKKYRVMRAQTAQLRAENDQLAAEIGRLSREAKALRASPAALERAAREELRFIRPGELVYRLDAAPPVQPQGATP